MDNLYLKDIISDRKYSVTVWYDFSGRRCYMYYLLWGLDPKCKISAISICKKYNPLGCSLMFEDRFSCCNTMLVVDAFKTWSKTFSRIDNG